MSSFLSLSNFPLLIQFRSGMSPKGLISPSTDSIVKYGQVKGLLTTESRPLKRTLRLYSFFFISFATSCRWTVLPCTTIMMAVLLAQKCQVVKDWKLQDPFLFYKLDSLGIWYSNRNLTTSVGSTPWLSTHLSAYMIYTTSLLIFFICLSLLCTPRWLFSSLCNQSWPWAPDPES